MQSYEDFKQDTDLLTSFFTAHNNVKDENIEMQPDYREKTDDEVKDEDILGQSQIHLRSELSSRHVYNYSYRTYLWAKFLKSCCCCKCV